MPICNWLARLVALTAAVAAALWSNAIALGQSSHEPATIWKLADGDTTYRLAVHRREPNRLRPGSHCEHLRLVAGHGTRVLVRHDIPHAAVIAELAPRLSIQSDRPGIQLLARVVLPRSRDPQSGRPLTAIVEGDSYTQVGRWQELAVERLPQRLHDRVRTMRIELGRPVDPREAFVDAIFVNAYGGPGVTNVWIADLELAGHARPLVGHVAAVQQASQESEPFTRAQSPAAREVRFDGSVLTVDGRPFFPRIIEHQGEPLAYLQGLGFNAVKLAFTPSADDVSEAAQAGVWLVCPPPPDEYLAEASTAAFGQQFDQVLAWDLGDGYTGRELEQVKRRVELLRRIDPVRGRLITCDPAAELKAYSRQLNVLTLQREPLLSGLELADYAAWLRERPRLAQLGTTVWTRLSTEPSPQLVDQLTALSAGRAPELIIASEQLRLLVHSALAADVRGLAFASRSRLDSADAPSRLRALTLQWINLQLELIEPWVASGYFVANIAASEGEVSAALLRTERAQLLLPVWSGRGAQRVPGQSAGNAVSFTVPGASEAGDAYELAPGGMWPLAHKRVTGGMRITLDELGPAAVVVITQDPLVLQHVQAKVARFARRAAQLNREIAGQKLLVTSRVDRRLGEMGHAISKAADWLSAARAELGECDRYLAAGDAREAYLRSERAMRPMRLLERAHWEAAIAAVDSPLASPFAVSYTTLPAHWALVENLRASKLGDNRLVGGRCEDLAAMRAAGWQHVQHGNPTLAASAELSNDAPHSGGASLRLRVQALDPGAPPKLIENVPIWVRTAPVQAAGGELLRIHGWVRVPEPITGSVDGLLVADSVSGDALAARIVQTDGWQEFTMFRAAVSHEPLVVTFALSGLGEAFIDDISIGPVTPPANSPP